MKARAIAMYIDDTLGGSREVTNTTNIQVADNGGAKFMFNTRGNPIGLESFNDGMTLTADLQAVVNDPQQPNWFALRVSREIVSLTVEFEGGLQLQFQGAVSKVGMAGDNQG
ncbi:MAG: hypothetical protein ACPGVG_15545, partial [Mycobacterium sp.]